MSFFIERRTRQQGGHAKESRSGAAQGGGAREALVRGNRL
jgi:hypothetical protein